MTLRYFSIKTGENAYLIPPQNRCESYGATADNSTSNEYYIDLSTDKSGSNLTTNSNADSMSLQKKVEPNYDVPDTTCFSSFTKKIILDSQLGKLFT